jgi:excisionase family DNA binding protein
MRGEKYAASKEYLSVRDAANLLGVSTRSIYGYVEMGRLNAIRVGASLALPIGDVQRFKRAVTGRPRQRLPQWHEPVVGNRLSMTLIRLRLREGTEKLLTQRVRQIRREQRHQINGTVARYLFIERNDPRNLHVQLLWREQVLPEESEREQAVAAFLAEFDDLLEPEQTRILEGEAIMHAQ